MTSRRGPRRTNASTASAAARGPDFFPSVFMLHGYLRARTALPILSRACCAVLAGVTWFAVGGAEALSAQATDSRSAAGLQAHLDPSRLRVTSDSFAIVANGAPRGSQRLSWSRPASGGWEMRDLSTFTAAVEQESIMTLDSKLREQSLRQTGTMRGAAMDIALDFRTVPSGVQVTGHATTPSATGTVTFDTVVAAGTLDDNAVSPLMGAVRWKEGLDVTFPVMSSGKGTVTPYRMRVLAADTVTVPAGHFDVWRIEQLVGRRSVMFYVTRRAPFRVVRMTQVGTPFDVVLVK